MKTGAEIDRKKLIFIIDVVLIIVYFWLSALFYSYQQNWSFLTSVFFVINTITTVGNLLCFYEMS